MQQEAFWTPSHDICRPAHEPIRICFIETKGLPRVYMIERMPIEFWVVFQIVVDLVLVILILYLLRSMRAGLHKDISREAAENLLQMIEPVLVEARSASKSFDTQLKEKSQLINQLNQRLDGRIITLNLLQQLLVTLSNITQLKRKFDLTLF